MNIITRIYLSIVRNAKKSFIMLALSFMIFSIISSSFVIRKAGKIATDFILKGTGGAVELDIRDSKEVNTVEKISTLFSSLEGNKEVSYSDYNYEKLLLPGNHFTSYAEGFDTYAEEFVSNIQNGTIEDYLLDEDNALVLSAYEKSTAGESGKIILCGENDAGILEARKKKIKLDISSGGRFFREEEIQKGENVCVVSTDFWINKPEGIRGPEVGDKIYFLSMFYDDNELVLVKQYELSVIGLYNTGDQTNKTCVYVPNNTIQKIQKEIDKDYLQYKGRNSVEKEMAMQIQDAIEIRNPRIEVFSTKSIEGLVGYIKEYLKDIDVEIVTSIAEYERIAGPVKGLYSLSNIIFLITVPLAIVLLCLCVLLQIKNEEKEIGIYSAMGEKGIVFQYIAKIMILGNAALILAVLLGTNAGNKMSNEYIKQYKVPQETNESRFYTVKTETIIKQFKDELKNTSSSEVLILGNIILLVTAGFSLIIINNIEPKKLLQGE